MDPKRWDEIKRIYNSALECEPAGREGFVREACSGDDSLRKEVESLLVQQGELSGFMSVPAMEVAAQVLAGGSGGEDFENMVGRSVAHYGIVEKIGEGGMGIVYKAHDTRLNRSVAIKAVPDIFAADPERLARFEREAKVLASLNHPNIASVYGLEKSDGKSSLVMELVEGKTLAVRLKKGRIPQDEALEICRQIAEGIEAAHEQGVLHRDLKPANIQITSSGKVKILDFGLARAIEKKGPDTDPASSPTITHELTRTGVILGTAAYMSPEQSKGAAVDRRTDIWAFGNVLYECLTGKRAFQGETTAETVASILKSIPDWQALPATTPPLIRRLLRRCLEKDPKRRLDSAATVRLEIEESMIAPSAADGDAGRPVPTSRFVWPRLFPWAVTGLIGMAFAATLLVWSPWRSEMALTRMALSLSRDNSLAIAGGVAISPDGRTLAFVARASGISKLYTRRLDEWEPHVVPLTDGALNPFFSPDGSWIAFGKGNFLKKVPISGGPPQDICRTGVQNTLGGEWRKDGTIVFAAWPQVGLWQVSSDGGTPQLITQPRQVDTASGNPAPDINVWYEWPQSLPNQKGILFTVWKGGRTSIALIAPGSDKPRTIVESGGHPRYLPTGHLLYVADRHLIAAPFDIDRLEVRGGATIVVDEVNETLLTSDYDVSEKGTLVYLPAGLSDYTIVWKDRKGLTVPVMTRARAYANLALSPDGERMSVRIQEGPSRNIWIGRVANDPLTRLTFGNDDAFGLWSRDGTRIFYSVGQSNYNIYWAATDGSGKAERLTRSPHAQNATSMSPDGDTIVFNDVDPISGSDIWEFSLSRKESRSLIKTPFTENGAKYSPDGRWIAYSSDESGQVEIYVQEYPGPGIKRQVSLEGGSAPFWSHTGRELFYATGTAIYFIPMQSGHGLRMGTPQRLFELTRFDIPTTSSSADDQRFLILERANPSAQLNLVQNSFEELKRLVPTGKK